MEKIIEYLEKAGISYEINPFGLLVKRTDICYELRQFCKSVFYLDTLVTLN